VDTAEFAARRAWIMAGIPDGIAVMLGAEAQSYPVRFRQSPDLCYLTGLEEPRLILVLNGVTKHAAIDMDHGTSDTSSASRCTT